MAFILSLRNSVHRDIPFPNDWRTQLRAIGYIYEAQDKILKKNVALKIEKKDKNKSILIFEYNVLNLLKGKCPT